MGRVVGIAGGRRKIAAIGGALAGKWINVLITDRMSAEQLLADRASWRARRYRRKRDEGDESCVYLRISRGLAGCVPWTVRLLRARGRVRRRTVRRAAVRGRVWEAKLLPAIEREAVDLAEALARGQMKAGRPLQ